MSHSDTRGEEKRKQKEKEKENGDSMKNERIFKGNVAQMVERSFRIRKARGSIPLISILEKEREKERKKIENREEKRERKKERRFIFIQK